MGGRRDDRHRGAGVGFDVSVGVGVGVVVYGGNGGKVVAGEAGTGGG